MFLLIDSMNKEKEKTGGNPMQVQTNVNTTGNKTPFLRKNTKSKNTVSPETEKKNVVQKELRQYVFNPQFSTPTSLPLSFYFGYQILHEMKELGQRGHVSLVINKVFRLQGKTLLVLFGFLFSILISQKLLD